MNKKWASLAEKARSVSVVVSGRIKKPTAGEFNAWRTVAGKVKRTT